MARWLMILFAAFLLAAGPLYYLSQKGYATWAPQREPERLQTQQHSPASVPFRLPLERAPAMAEVPPLVRWVGACKDFRGRVHYSFESHYSLRPGYANCMGDSDPARFSTSHTPPSSRALGLFLLW